MAKIGRNEPCPCGSGKKYKKCCRDKSTATANLPKVVTAGGEEMVFLEAHYDLRDREQAIALLDAAEDYEVEEIALLRSKAPKLSCDWLQRGESARQLGNQKPAMPGPLNMPSSSRLLGEVILKPNRLILHAQGPNRFEVGKWRLEALLGDLIRHRLDSVQSLESAMNDAEEHFPLMPGPPPTIQDNDPRFGPLAEGETLQEAVENRGFESLEEINLFADRVMQDYNNQPQPDMAGLSPVQVRRLLDVDWEDENGPLRLNMSLTPAEVRNTPLLHNVRLLVKQCESEGGAKVTSAGNLNRKTVAELIPKLILMDEHHLDYLQRKRTTINEQDIWMLHLTRVIAELAGLLRKYKRRFVATKRGLALTENENTPELYLRLFLTTFRKFNLGYHSHVGHPDMQSTMAYSLHVLSKLPHGAWKDAEENLAELLLPAVRDHLIESSDSEHFHIILKAAVCNWILVPLVWFGLLETKEKELFQLGGFRTTSLYGKFISFHH